eukprot:g11256.t1
MVGSLEFCIGKLRSRLILVLGHSHCSAVYGATQSYFDTLEARSNSQEVITASSALDGLLLDLSCVAEQAAGELGVDRSIEDVAHHAVKLNVFHTVNFLLKFSSGVRGVRTAYDGRMSAKEALEMLKEGKIGSRMARWLIGTTVSCWEPHWPWLLMIP